MSDRDGGITPESPVASIPEADNDWIPSITGAAPMDATATSWSKDSLSMFVPGTCQPTTDDAWTCSVDDADGAITAARVDKGKNLKKALKSKGFLEPVAIEVAGASEAQIARTSDPYSIAVAIRANDNTHVLIWKASGQQQWSTLGFGQSIQSVKVTG